jgi:hypothetical protein
LSVHQQLSELTLSLIESLAALSQNKAAPLTPMTPTLLELTEAALRLMAQLAHEAFQGYGQF